MQPIILDIIKEGRFYKQLKYTKRGFPQMLNGKIVETHDADDIRKFVEESLPSLKGKDYNISFTNQKTMKVEVTRVTSWKDVLNAARFTQRKEPLDKEPSDDFKRKIIRAEHSPLRCLMFNIDLYDIPRFVSDHLVRHIHAQPFVSTGRHDIIQELPSRHEQRMDDLYNMRLFLNAQEIINISKVRLCTKAEKKTRDTWQQVINELYKQEPLLATACVPSCIYRNMCPELKCCGYAGTDAYLLAREEYCNILM